MLQWMGGSRRKVTTSRGSTQKRQKQYFEQRRRQQQQQVSVPDNCLEDNLSSASNSERKSLDVLSLTTLSTVAQESSPRCLNELDAAGINVAGNELEINAPQPAFLAHSANRGKDSVGSVAKEKAVCDRPSNTEMKSFNTKVDPWNNEISVLDILEDDDLKYNIREIPRSEDHVSFSVGGLGKVGTETPSPPHRIEPRGGILCSKASRGVEISKKPLTDLELDVDAVLQDIDTSISGKSYKFSSNSTCHFETFEKQIPEMCFPVDDMGFDNFDGSFGGVVRGKRADDINANYKENRYHAHSNFIVDDFLKHEPHDLPWEHGPHREYMNEDFWESRNLEEKSFKRKHFFSERDTEIPMDSFNFTDTDFTTFHTPEKNFNFDEVISRSPSQFYSPVEDPKDGSMSSEESCSSSAVRRDLMNSVAKKRDIFNKLWSMDGRGKCTPRRETSHGDRNYAQQGETAVENKASADKFDTSSLPSGLPSRFTVDNKLKTRDGWFGSKEKPKSDVDSGLASFCKDSVSKPKACENRPRYEGYMSAFADSNLRDRPKIDIPKSRYSPHERTPCTPFVESHGSPWMPDLSLKSEVPDIPTRSYGVTKPIYSTSGCARKNQEMENPLAGVLDCYTRQKNIDFFAMGVVQIEDEERCSYRSNRKSPNVTAEIQCPEFRGMMKSSAALASDEYRITETENENQHEEDPDGWPDRIKHKEDQDPPICVNPSKVAETSIVNHTEQRTVGMKNIAASPLDHVLRHQRYFIQFMCVQQASVEKLKDI